MAEALAGLPLRVDQSADQVGLSGHKVVLGAWTLEPLNNADISGSKLQSRNGTRASPAGCIGAVGPRVQTLPGAPGQSSVHAKLSSGGLWTDLIDHPKPPSSAADPSIPARLRLVVLIWVLSEA
ncbi:hypothetical protein E4U19_004379 [Claviceps sp. Clav32 group G5]|nr:hypothetical protein E4U19_004379 [Claviceps sp. Clav32 group G5]